MPDREVISVQTLPAQRQGWYNCSVPNDRSSLAHMEDFKLPAHLKSNSRPAPRLDAMRGQILATEIVHTRGPTPPSFQLSTALYIPNCPVPETRGHN